MFKLVHPFLWEYSHKRLELAQLLGQLGEVRKTPILTCVRRISTELAVEALLTISEVWAALAVQLAPDLAPVPPPNETATPRVPAA